MLKKSLFLSLLLILFSCVSNKGKLTRKYQLYFFDKKNIENKNMVIPKIIHQVWHSWTKESKPSEKQKKWMESYKKLHSNWKYILWDNKKSEDFVKEHYPDFYHVYKSYDQNIKRADSIRYLILKHYGGVYIDISSFPLKPLDDLLRSHVFVAAEESLEEKQINMAFLASVKDHPILDFFISQLAIEKDKHVLEATGPKFITKYINLFLEKDKNNSKITTIYHPKYIYPFWFNEVDKDKPKKCLEDNEQCKYLFPDAFIIKVWTGSWK